MSKRSITIGIPAYNEAANIRALLTFVLAQRLSVDTEILEILVVADGCTDDTVAEVKAVHDQRVRLIERSQRRGLVAAQNTIVREARGEFLIMFDADVQPVGTDCVATLVAAMVADPTIGLASPVIEAAPARGAFEQVMATGHQLKNSIYRRMNHGDNVYMCHGRARIFSRAYYQHLTWPAAYAEDAYSYFACRQAGFRFAFLPDATVQFRSPTLWYDHLKQSLRFLHGKKHMRDIFDPSTVRQAYALPMRTVWSAVWDSLRRHPWATIGYIGSVMITRALAWAHHQQDHTTFSPAVTSKLL